LLQPFRDAIKLFRKEVFIILKSNYYIYYICPIILFILMIGNWIIYGFVTNIYYLNYSLLILIIILTIMGYMFMFIGWFSNSIYSLIGAVRAISQTLSYEVRLIMIFFSINNFKGILFIYRFYKMTNIYMIWIYIEIIIFSIFC